MSVKKKAASKTAKTKNSLVNNINAKKKAGTAHSKKNSTVSKEDYNNMESNWNKVKEKK